MKPSPAEEIINTVLHQIRCNLGNVASQFGPIDYQKEWKPFRDYLFGFAQSFCQAMDYHLREKPEDTWTQLNAGVMDRLRPEQLLKIASQCHYLSYAIYPYNFTCYSQDTKQLIIALNWLTNIYGNEHEQTERWFKLCCEQIEYPWRYAVLRNAAYREIAAVTSNDPEDDQRSGAWGGLAMIAGFVQSQYEEKNREEWTKECEKMFA
jgi:hypothetical protein